MRLYRNPALCRAFATALRGHRLSVRFRAPVSAFGQDKPASTALPQQPQTARMRPPRRRPLKIRRTKRCGWRSRTTWGSRAERLGSADRDLQPGAPRAPPTRFNLVSRTSTQQRSTRLPATSSSAGRRDLTNANFRTNGGLQQLVPWGGGRYSVGLDASRGHDRTTLSRRIQPAARLRPQRPVHPAAAAQFQDRPNAPAGRCQPEAAVQTADIQLRQQHHADRRAASGSPTTIWSDAIGGLRSRAGIAGAGADSAQEQPDARRSRHDGADRHRPGAKRKSRATRNRSSSTQATIKSAQDKLRIARHEPVAAGLLDDALRAERAAGR